MLYKTTTLYWYKTQKSPEIFSNSLTSSGDFWYIGFEGGIFSNHDCSKKSRLFWYFACRSENTQVETAGQTLQRLNTGNAVALGIQGRRIDSDAHRGGDDCHDAAALCRNHLLPWYTPGHKSQPRSTSTPAENEVLQVFVSLCIMPCGITDTWEVPLWI